MKLTELTTTVLKQVNIEFKLYAIGHNLKRIYNEKNRKKQLKFSKNKNQLNFVSLPHFNFLMEIKGIKFNSNIFILKISLTYI